LTPQSKGLLIKEGSSASAFTGCNEFLSCVVSVLTSAVYVRMLFWLLSK